MVGYLTSCVTVSFSITTALHGKGKGKVASVLN